MAGLVSQNPQIERNRFMGACGAVRIVDNQVVTKAIILAAGAGRRMGSMGWSQPKCLLPCPGGTLLDHMLDCLIQHGIRDVVLAVGYERELVEQRARRHGHNFVFVENALYASSNTAYSLALVRDSLQGDCLYFNADVWFEAAVLDELLANPNSALLVDPTRNDAEAVKVVADGSGRVMAIGKQLSSQECSGEFVGIGLFRDDLCSAMQPGLERIATTQQGRGSYFESVLHEILAQVVVNSVPIRSGQAMEIDTPEDYREAQRLWGSG